MANGIANNPKDAYIAFLTGNTPSTRDSLTKTFDFPTGFTKDNTVVVGINTLIGDSWGRNMVDPDVIVMTKNDGIYLYIPSTVQGSDDFLNKSITVMIARQA